MRTPKWSPLKTGAMTSTKDEYHNESLWGSTIIDGSYYVVLIDKSDTTNFPHGSTTSLRVSNVALEGLIGTNFSGDIHIGQMGTTAPGTQVIGVMNTWKKYAFRVTNGPRGFGGVGDGFISQYFPGDMEADNAVRTANLTVTGSHFPNDRPLPCPATGTTRVGTGDICLWIKHTAGSLTDFNVRLTYHSH